MRRVAQVPTPDINELRITLRRPHGREVADGPDGEAGEPEAEAQADRAAGESNPLQAVNMALSAVP